MYLTQTEADAKGLPSVQEQIDRHNQAIRDLKGKGNLDGDTFVPSPEQHNCEYALTGCKGFGLGQRVRSAHGREA